MASAGPASGCRSRILLEGQYIGLEEVGDGIWDVYYSDIRLGQMDERILKIEDALGRRKRNGRL